MANASAVVRAGGHLAAESDIHAALSLAVAVAESTLAAQALCSSHLCGAFHAFSVMNWASLQKPPAMQWSHQMPPAGGTPALCNTLPILPIRSQPPIPSLQSSVCNAFDLLKHIYTVHITRELVRGVLHSSDPRVEELAAKAANWVLESKQIVHHHLFQFPICAGSTCVPPVAPLLTSKQCEPGIFICWCGA
jgi:hypothetical protein